MEELLHLEIRGKFNGRDAQISISLDAEEVFQIEDVSAGDSNSQSYGSTDDDAAMSESTTSPAENTSTEQPITATSPEGAGLDQLFPEDDEIDEDDIPPLRSSSNQFSVANAMYLGGFVGGQRTCETSGLWDFIKTNSEKLNIELDDNWSREKVNSNVYKLVDKGIADASPGENQNKKAYTLTEVGAKAVEQNRPDDWDVPEDNS